MLAVMAVAFLLVFWVATKALSFSSSKSLRFLEKRLPKTCLPCGGYTELGMFDDAAMVLEEIAP
jgi:hypothetical protein